MHNNKCLCGKELHYSDKEVEKYMVNLVKELGRFIHVVDDENNKTYKVDRHYIALHGIKQIDLDKLNFEEV